MRIPVFSDSVIQYVYFSMHSQTFSVLVFFFQRNFTINEDHDRGFSIHVSIAFNEKKGFESLLDQKRNEFEREFDYRLNIM